MNGSELVFEMGNKPNKNWGAETEARPKSGKFENATTLPSKSIYKVFFLLTLSFLKTEFVIKK